MNHQGENFDLVAYNHTRRTTMRRTAWAHLAAVLTSLVLFTPMMAHGFIHGEDQMSTIGATAASLGLVGLLSLLISGIALWPILNPYLMGRITGLDSTQQSTVEKIYDSVASILKLNPPATVLEEILEVQAMTNQVVGNLLALKRMVPKEDLTHSSPMKWLLSAVEQLKKVQSELEEARFQAYTTPIEPLSLERSSEAIREEKRFVSEVLGRGQDSTAILPSPEQVSEPNKV